MADGATIGPLGALGTLLYVNRENPAHGYSSQEFSIATTQQPKLNVAFGHPPEGLQVDFRTTKRYLNKQNLRAPPSKDWVGEFSSRGIIIYMRLSCAGPGTKRT